MQNMDKKGMNGKTFTIEEVMGGRLKQERKEKKKIYFLCILANVDSSILDVKLDHGLKASKSLKKG